MGLRVTLYFDAENEPEVLEDVDYVSFINESTYGPPPLIAPAKRPEEPRAGAGDSVLYVNTNLVPAVQIERLN